MAMAPLQIIFSPIDTPDAISNMLQISQLINLIGLENPQHHTAIARRFTHDSASVRLAVYLSFGFLNLALQEINALVQLIISNAF